MELSEWLLNHWLDLLQSIGIIAGLFFTAYSTRRDEGARKIGNMLSIADQHRQIWKEFFSRPQLSRVIEPTLNLEKDPISHEEQLFVTLLILHLGNVHRAMKAGMFITLEGLQKDIRGFFSRPIPRAVWGKTKLLQDADFVRFVEGTLKSGSS